LAVVTQSTLFQLLLSHTPAQGGSIKSIETFRSRLSAT